MTRGIAAATAAIGLVVVAGCGTQGARPQVLHPLPAKLATAQPAVEQQVEAAVRHYFDVANVALRTGDTRELESLSLPGCGCRTLVTAIHQAFAHGQPRGARILIRSIKVHDLTVGSAGAEVAFTMTSYVEVTSAGEDKYPPHRGIDDISLVKNPEWIVSNGIQLA